MFVKKRLYERFTLFLREFVGEGNFILDVGFGVGTFIRICCLPKFDRIFNERRHTTTRFNVFYGFVACFTDAFILHKSGNVEVMAKCIAFIFAFDAEMVAGHVHLFCWSGTGFYGVKRDENRPDLECLDG